MTAPEHTSDPRTDGDAEPLLRVRGLTKRFGGVRAVTDVGFDVRPDTVRAIIGPNGAGKTTLLDLITGFSEPDAGTRPLRRPRHPRPPAAPAPRPGTDAHLPVRPARPAAERP